MWFVLRMTFWLGVVLVLLPNLGSHACRKPRKVLGRQVLRLGLHHFGRRAVKGDAPFSND
jgi:hypothetical protein